MMKETQIKSLILVENALTARAVKKFVGRAYSVMSTEGFLKDLPKSRIGIDENYIPGYITVRGQGTLLQTLKRETMKAGRVFLATNPDAKGEFLARQCCELFGINEKSNCRMLFDELTKTAVKSALKNPRPIDENLADAFQTRQIIDKYISHKIGYYLSCKIYRGVKVGRFRGMLLKLINDKYSAGEFNIGQNFTPSVLQELALRELNFSVPKTRFVVEQLYEGFDFEKEGYGGLIKYPHGGEIQLSSDKRDPESVKKYLSDSQFKLYELIYSQDKISRNIELPNFCDNLSLLAKLDGLGVDWTEFYGQGISSLLKRKYIVDEDENFIVTELGKKVLNALEGFFDDILSVESYKKIAAQIQDVAEGKADKNIVVRNCCDDFNDSFDEAMESLGENPQPKDEPIIESDKICEKCGRTMIIKHGRYGLFLACSGYPECKNTKPYVSYLAQKCPKCGHFLTQQDFGKGRYLYRCSNYDFETWDVPQERVCRECGATMFVRRFRNRPSMFYCGNENCPTRVNHPINKILAESAKRSEARKLKKQTEKKS